MSFVDNVSITCETLKLPLMRFVLMSIDDLRLIAKDESGDKESVRVLLLVRQQFAERSPLNSPSLLPSRKKQ